MKSNIFVGLAIALMILLNSQPIATASSSGTMHVVPNLLAGLTSFGFAISGGLALIAAALTSSNRSGP